MNIPKSLDFQTFSRLRRIYIIALGAIALFTIFGQLVIQQFISSQLDDSQIINISGRQRMLSQKLVKELLLLQTNNDSYNSTQQLLKIEQTLTDWTNAHERLIAYNLKENNSSVFKEFEEMEPVFKNMRGQITTLIQLYKTPNPNPVKSQQLLDSMIELDPVFLKKMDAIVQLYEKNAKKKVVWLQYAEYVLSLMVLLILLAELILLFRPVALGVKQTISNLIASERKATKMALNAERLRKIQNENVQERTLLTKAIDQILLYARVDEEGRIITMGKRFAKILKIEDHKQTIVQALNLDELQQNRLMTMLQQRNGGVFNEQFHIKKDPNIHLWLDISALSIYKKEGVIERLILCADSTKRMLAQQKLEQVLSEKFRVKEEMQRLTVSQIVEAQEEERKRIAKEIHDSIGQMLTALKFNIEALNLENIEKTAIKIEGLKKLSKDLIKGIRIATFNLTPPELKDHGIIAALEKMVTELKKLTDKHIVVDNQTTHEFRFDTLVETNLYRVTQEAVNNAIKYAGSNIIMITIKNSETLVSITIQDDGNGFDLKSIPENPQNNAEGGMGLFFMKERMHYIDGRIFIKSKPGKGTKITLNYPFEA